MSDPTTPPPSGPSSAEGTPQPAPPAAYPPPPAAPPVYGAAPAYAYPQGPKTNTLAIVSLISSLVGLFVIPIIGQIVGVITGHMSLSQIKQTGENGRGLGLAGVIIGWVSLGLWIIGIVAFVLFLVAVSATSVAVHTS